MAFASKKLVIERKSKMSKPGIMIYHELYNPFKKLSDEDRGKLILAMLEYSIFGAVPSFCGVLDMMWDFVSGGIDRDGERYERVCSQRSYAAYCKHEKENGKNPISFDDWLASAYDRTRPQANGKSRMRNLPTTTSTPIPITTPTTMPVATPNTMAVATASTIPTEIASAIAKGMSASKNILQ